MGFPGGAAAAAAKSLQSCPILCDPIDGSPQVALVVKNLPAPCRTRKRRRFNPWVGKISWRKAWQPIPVFLPGCEELTYLKRPLCWARLKAGGEGEDRG